MAARVFGVTLPAWPREKAWFFNPCIWQFIFMLGIAAGVFRGRKPLPLSPVLLASALAFLLASLVVSHASRSLVPDGSATPSFPGEPSSQTPLPMVSRPPGSSTTAGVGACSPEAAYPARLAEEIETRLPTIDVDIGASCVGGETAAQTLERLEREVARLKPDLVVWQVGTNDALADVGEDVFRTLVERGIAAATAHGADLVLLDQQFYPTIRRNGLFERTAST